MKIAFLNLTLVSGLVGLGVSVCVNSGCSACPSGTQLKDDGKCYLADQSDGTAGESADGKAPDDRARTNAVAKNDGNANAGRSGAAGADEASVDAGTRAPRVASCGGHSGGLVCDEQGKMLMCGASGDAKALATCRSKELCEAGLSARNCAVCLPGDAKCQGAMLMRCGPDGSAYAPENDCMSAQLCDATKGTCKPSACAPDTYVCEGDRLSVCKTDLTGYQFSKQCPAGLCDAESKDCKQCNPGSMSCNGNTIMSCDSAGKRLESGETCGGQTPVCDSQLGCVECKAKADCKIVHDCADLVECSAGACKYAAKPRRTSIGDGDLVRAGNPDPDPIYVVFGGALFYISTEDEVNKYGGFSKVQIKPLSYARCPVPGTMLTQRGDPAGYIYVSDGKQLNWVKSPADLETYCGGSANVITIPADSLSTTSYPPPAGLCPVNRN